MIQVQAPDGSIVEFPDGTDDATMERAMRDAFGAPAAQAAPQPSVSPVMRAIENVVTPAAPAAPAPQPAAPNADQSLIDYIMGGASATMGVADQAMRGAATGATNILGLPNAIQQGGLSVLEWGLDKVGAPDPVKDAVGGFKSAIDIFPSAEGMQGVLDGANNVTADALGVERPRVEPDNFAERATNRIFEEVGAAAVPAGAALNKARAVGVEGARRIPGIVGRYVESAAVNPARFAQGEAAVAMGAGTGAATANELVDRETTGGMLADLFGAVAGGSAVGLGSTIASSAGDILSALFQRSNYVDDVVKEAVVDRIGQAAGLPGAGVAGGVMDTSPLVSAIEDTSRARPSAILPGYQETLADTTGNAGLAALEYGRAAGPAAGQFNMRRVANNEVVDQALTALEPKQSPAALRDALDAQREQMLTDAIMGRQTATDAAADALRPVTPASTPAQRGGVVRESLEGAREAARNRTEEAYAAANIAGRQVDPAPLANALDEAVGGLTEVERGLVPQGVIDRVRSLGQPLENGPQPTGILDAQGNAMTRPPRGPEPVAMKEATDLKSELQRLQRAALADPRAERGGRNAARVLGQMIDTVEGFVMRNLDETDRTALDAARGAKFDEAERFTRQGDPVARALGRYEGGQPQVADDRVAGLFSNPQAMDRLFAQADTPEVRAAIRDEVLSRAGTGSADDITRFMSENAEQIRRFPGLSDELTRAAGARTAEKTATDNVTKLERDLGTAERGGRSTVGRYLQFSDANAERAMGEVLSAKDPGKAADDLLSFVGDSPAAVEGARSAFWKKLKSESQSTDNSTRGMGGKRQWRGDWLKSWLNEPSTKAVAERLYRDKPEDMDLLNAYADVLDNADLRTRGKTPGTSGTAQGVSNIMTPETLQSRMYAYMRGQVSGTYLATSIAAVMARRAVRGARAEAIERMTDKVLLNPQIAKELLKENNPANRAALARKAKGWFGNEAATILDLVNDDEDETKRAVMGDR